VFTRKRPSKSFQLVDSKVDDVRQVGDFLSSLRIDEGPNVHASSTRMGIVGHVQSAIVAESLDACDIGCQVFNRNGGVLDERDRLVITAYAHQESKPHLPDTPDISLSDRRRHGNDSRRGRSSAIEVLPQRIQLGGHFGFRMALVFRDQHTLGIAFNKTLKLLAPHRRLAAHRHTQVIQQFNR